MMNEVVSYVLVSLIGLMVALMFMLWTLVPTGYVCPPGHELIYPRREAPICVAKKDVFPASRLAR